VTVACAAYNHEKYISRAIEGFLKQKTSFPVEIIIHDDASTDKTAQIIKEFASEHPELIVPVLQTENQFSKKQGSIYPRFIFPLAKGKYIALCDGDDYWIDPNKLQKQVSFLEKNPDFSICFHKVRILKEGRFFKDFMTKVPSEITTIEDLANGNYIQTPSVIFRNGLFNDMSWLFRDCPVGDYVTHLLNARNGKIKYIDEVMAVYRIHPTSFWSSMNQIDRLKKWINMQDLLIKYFPGKIGEIIKQDQVRKKIELIECLISSPFFNEKNYNADLNLESELIINHYQHKIKSIYSSKDYLIGNAILSPARYIMRLLN
jgi:glycosyltransferase involved in cell wall biosynthesis